MNLSANENDKKMCGKNWSWTVNLKRTDKKQGLYNMDMHKQASQCTSCYKHEKTHGYKGLVLQDKIKSASTVVNLYESHLSGMHYYQDTFPRTVLYMYS